MFIKKYYKVILILGFLILSGISATVVADRFSKPESYKKTISIIDKKKDNVLGLVASSTTLSATLSLIPGDAGTPIAQQFASLSSYLMIILSILYTEKYLLTVFGLAVFRFLLPASLIGFGINLYLNNYTLQKILIKLISVSVILMLIVPVSTRVTNMIDETYQTSLIEDVTGMVDDGKEETTPNPVESDSGNQTEENKPWYMSVAETISNAVGSVLNVAASATEAVTDYAKNIIEKARKTLNNFIEATAVMLVTSCVIPLITFFVFTWLMKLVLELDFISPNISGIQKRIKGSVIKTIDNVKSSVSQ